MALPIFVVGRNRSGTTWLANQLCEHPQIVGCQHERHHGIHESAYFGYIDGRYGNLSHRINYAEFVEALASSDFFCLAGASKDFLYSLWPTTYEEVFRKVMDRFADERGAVAWVEKSDIREKALSKVAASYPDARFVAIVRDVVANTASTLASPGAQDKIGNRTWAIVRATLAWSHSRKIARALARSSGRMLIIHYENLRADKEATLRQVLDFLGLKWDPRVLGQTYKPQSTFRSAKERRDALSAWEKWLVRAVAVLSKIVPRAVLGLLDRLRSRYRGRPTLPWWFYRLQPFFADDATQYDDVYGRSSNTGSPPEDPAGNADR